MALLDIVKRIAALTPPDVLLGTIADAARRLFRFETGGFRLLDGDELVIAGQWGDPAMIRPRIKIGESLSGRVAATGQVLISHDLPDDPRLDPLHQEADRRLGYRTYVGAPLRIGAHVIGVLALRSRERRELTSTDVAILQAFADQAAIALENARLYDAAQRQRREAQALTEIARDVSAALDRDTVLLRVVEHARRLCLADLVILALCEPDGATAVVVAKSGHHTDLYDHAVFESGRGLAGQVLATGDPVTTPDRLSDPRWPVDDLARAEAIQAVAGVPVLAGDRLLGVLLVHRRRADAFNPGEVATVDALARHAAIAIQNASLYEAVQARLEELRTSQDRLVKTERLRALGEMASGVAHDFNNLLAVILGRTQLLMKRSQDTYARQGLTVIESAATEAAQTVRRIQEFTRTRQTRAHEPVDVGQAVHEAVELTKGRWKDEAQVRGVTYSVTTEIAETPVVAGEPGELREVFATLLLNAFDAMPTGGSVALTVKTSADSVIARVRDTGPGMPAEIRQRIFEPFFTTKGPSRTGLGLSVAYGIIQRHRGSIEVDSVEDRGTTFTITLPVAARGEATATGSEGPEPGVASKGRAARVLVIEDESMVREVLLDVLGSAGHVSLAAADGPAGLAMLDPATPLDVALIDLGLPGMSGLEVAARIRALHPTLPLVLVTGWADRLDPEVLQRSGISRVIAKPFQTTEILQIVAAAAAHRATPGP